MCKQHVFQPFQNSIFTEVPFTLLLLVVVADFFPGVINHLFEKQALWQGPIYAQM